MSTAHMHHDGAWESRPGGRAWLREARRTGNPLLRLPTRRERAVRMFSIGLLVAATLATGLGCGLVLRAGLVEEQAQADRRPVTVTVLRQLEPSAAGNAYLNAATLEVRYQVGGAARVSTMPTIFGAVNGTTLDAWVDRAGNLASRPQTRLATVVQTLLAAVGGLVLLVGLALGGWVGYVAWTEQLRGDEWEAEWLAYDTTGPTR
jgi:hypothetical protein